MTDTQEAHIAISMTQSAARMIDTMEHTLKQIEKQLPEIKKQLEDAQKFLDGRYTLSGKSEVSHE